MCRLIANLFCLTISQFLILGHVQADSLSMNISGYIDDRCELNFGANNTMDFSEEVSKTLPFEIYCNQPVILAISSKNGGLKHEDNELVNLTRYSVNLDVSSINISKELNSEDITTPVKIDSFGAIPFSSIGQLGVTLEHSLLYAGYYKDVIEIDIYPSINNVTK
ncbi:hypothetical protein [Vibrio sp. WZ-1]|uniref:hypothetical protein n=1 Tax=Vibrio sp. WZ-1 TaxID=3454501 RepID=UPI003F83F362